MIMQGIDISHHNYTVVKNNGQGWLKSKATLGFVILKATEGVTFDDPRFMDYIRMMGEADIMNDYVCAGSYHYARPENNDPISEAKHYLSIVGRFKGHMVMALDVEGRALSYPNIDKWCFEWLEYIRKETGVRPLVYCQRSALNLFDLVPENNYGLWLAAWQKQPPKNPAPWKFMAIWQNNGMNIDTDFFYGSPDQWKKYAACK